jgi:alkylation response protein AidB-like acyl-CoA dehydrogenase
MSVSAVPATNPLEAARALTPEIRARAGEIEALRQLPGDLATRMIAAGLMHLSVPRVYGGVESDALTTLETVEEVSAADGSAGWCSMIASQNGFISGLIDRSEAKALWGNGGVVAGSARPIGRATRDGQDWRVHGRWPFASGSSHATAFAGECLVYENGEVVRNEAGETPSYFAVLDREQVTIHDTWHTTGLRGTASNDFSFENLIVPARRFFELGPPVIDIPLYRSFALMFTTHGAHALGVGRAAIESAKEIGRAKIGYGTDRPVSEGARLQAQLAEAVVLVESARDHLHAATRRLWDALERGDEPGTLNGRVRLATSHAATASLRAVDILHGALATSAIFQKSPLERQFRDMHTAAAHVMVGPLTYEAAGRVELGLPAGMPFFE